MLVAGVLFVDPAGTDEETLLRFRGSGPSDDRQDAIQDTDVREFRVDDEASAAVVPAVDVGAGSPAAGRRGDHHGRPTAAVPGRSPAGHRGRPP